MRKHKIKLILSFFLEYHDLYLLRFYIDIKNLKYKNKLFLESNKRIGDIFLTTECDILVVGGGPAGVISAYTAARNKLHVILADSKSIEEIGNKTCGDALELGAPTLLKNKLGLELPYGKEISDNFEKMVIETEHGSIDLYDDGVVLDRHLYGQRLLKEAINAGVDVYPHHRGIKAITNDNWVIGAEFKNSETNQIETIKAKVTIDCSGRNYIIRKTLPQEKFPYMEVNMDTNDIAASYREIIHLNEDHQYHNRIHLIYDRNIPLPGYYWIFSKGPYELNIGIGWKLSAEGKGKNMRNIYDKINNKYFSKATYKVISSEGYTIPFRYPILNAVDNGFMAAGDAAYHVHPLFGGGHGSALIAGYYAGKQAIQALESGLPTMEALWDYNQNCFNAFGIEHCKAQLLTEMINSITLDGLDHIFKRKILSQSDFSKSNKGESLGIGALIQKILRMAPK